MHLRRVGKTARTEMGFQHAIRMTPGPFDDIKRRIERLQS